MTGHAPTTGRRATARLLRRVLAGIVLLPLLIVGGTAFRVWQVARLDDRSTADIAVVLGAAQYGGRPSDVLEARLAHAQQLFERGVARTVVTVGGRGLGDTYTEAEAGQRWLVGDETKSGTAKKAIPKDKVVAVNEGADTLGSLQAVAREAEKRGWHSAVIVSDPWHSLRARTMAGDTGLAAWASPTRRGPIVQTRETQLRYILRETAGVLYYRLTHTSTHLADNGLG
ncbi:YdcF family protein [Crossiella sp. CA198]|uniref:YdcF family protein n=1 Tax=Crossiella sp. CA198 TaxID=3455607 RepID=UPI003F8D6A31